MSGSSKAVFLSYASQDAEGAKRICDALRAAGVEVWFDQSELVGGDAWDRKIRQQIKECALFVPVISANTQARAEGYFRLEWLLAVERSRLMAEEKAFLVPVVIDDTADATAIVPEKFRDVQWTRLPGGDTPEKFCARVKRLLGGSDMEPGRPLGSVALPKEARPGERGSDFAKASTDREGAASPARQRPAWPRFALGALAIIITGVAVFFALRPHRGPEEVAKLPASAPTIAADAAAKSIPATTAPAPVSPAREWVVKARTLFEPWDLATQDDFNQAELFLKRAIDLDPSDGEAWAAQAMLSFGFAIIGHDKSPARMNSARVQAERAVKLAPASDYARFALASALRFDGNARSEVVRLHRELVERNPRDKFMLREFGAVLGRTPGALDEGLGFLARAAAPPGGDPIAEGIRSLLLRNIPGRQQECLAALDRALTIAPNYADAHIDRITILLRDRGDLAAARDALAKVPTALLREDRCAAAAVKVWFALNQPDRVLRALGPAGAYFETRVFRGPAAYLKGLAHRRAGRLPAAEAEWRVALQEVQRRLEANPNDLRELLWKARVLALLGDRVEAKRTFDLGEQLSSGDTAQRFPEWAEAAILMAKPNETLRLLVEQLTTGGVDSRQSAAFTILFNPTIDPLRADPQFAPLVEQAKAFYAERRNFEDAKK